MQFYNKVMHCDCCHKRIHSYSWYKNESFCFAFPAYTTEGHKWLCGHCLYCYNILDRFPTEKERNLDPSELNKIRIKERGI